MEKKSRKGIIIGVTSLLLVTLILIGLTYAYYRTRIIGNPNDESINVTSKKLEVTYQNESAYIEATDVEPGDSFTKTFEVTNTGSEKVYYSIKLDNVVNTFTRNDWKYKLYSGSEALEANLLKSGALTDATIQIIDPSVEIESSEEEQVIQKYTLVLEYLKLDNVDQSDDMGKNLSLRINIGNELELLANSTDIQVGDYVYYNYLDAGEYSRVYTTPTVETGKSVYTETQTFDSASNVRVNNWRVLSIAEDGIEIVADIPKTEGFEGLIMYGDNGWVNGSTILNEMTDALYSSDFGKASSLKVEDFIIPLDYPQAKIYYNNAGTKVEIPASESKTVGNLESELGLKLTNRIAPSNIIIDNLEVDLLNVNYKALHEFVHGDAQLKQIELIFNSANILDPYCPAYWLASKGIDLNFKNDIVKYRQYFIMNDKLMGRHLYNSMGEIQEDVLEETYKVRPIVKLNNNVYLDSEKIQIDVNNDGVLEVEAWTLSLN